MQYELDATEAAMVDFHRLSPEAKVAKAQETLQAQRDSTLAKMTDDERKAFLTEEARVAALPANVRQAEALLSQKVAIEASLAALPVEDVAPATATVVAKPIEL